MKFRKSWKRFWTLDRHHSDGFTLVELIVVIAILAILAGVGTVGYSGYIKSANKNADKVLVGNIIRAIETGTYSTMFESDDSFTKGATTYPVGIITLTKDGCEVKASTSTRSTTTGTCHMKTIYNFVPTGKYTITETVDEVTTLVVDFHTYHDIYEISDADVTSVTFCETHTNLNERNLDISYSGDACNGYDFVTKPYVLEDECTGIYELKMGPEHVEGGTIDQENIEAANPDSDDPRVVNTTSSPIYNSLVAAFGSTADMKLTYDGWGKADGEGHTYATLYSYTDTMIKDIEDTASLLINAVYAAKTFGVDPGDYLTEDYEDSSDMMDSFSNYFMEKYPVYDDPNTANTSDWKAVWGGAKDGTTAYAFGLNATLDYCYGARKAYNISFASYCDAAGIEDDYLEVLKKYHHIKRVHEIPLEIPDVVNSAAFANKNADDENTLYAQFVKAGDRDGTVFDKCATLYENYKNSETCTQNGKIFYDTMNTLKQTGSEAFKYGEGGKDGYFDYYENMMKEMGAYYDYIKNYNGSGIIILVTVENGVVKCDVSPSAANPRNDS